MSRIITMILAIVAAFVATVAQADSPMPPPSKMTEMSPDGQISAISDPHSGTTKITKSTNGKLLWEIPRWERWLFVANDGKHVVAGYHGMNLIPRNYDDQLIVFTFWREGKIIREVTLGEFLAGKSPPRRTASHYNWGWIEKIDSDGLLVVYDSDHNVKYRYDLKTGLEAK